MISDYNNFGQISPFISVLISCYNYEKYVRRCLTSCSAQTFTDFEVIIVDDASKDHSAKTITNYLSSVKFPARFIELETNGGPAIAKGTALNNASGTYIIFVDCDDWMDCDCLETLANNAKASNSDKIRAQARIREEDSGKIKRERLIPKKPNIWTEGMMYTTLIKHQLIKDNNIAFCDDRLVSDDLYFISRVNAHVKTAEYIRKTVYTISYKKQSDSGTANPDLSRRITYNMRTNEKIFSDVYSNLDDQNKTLCEYLFIKQYYFMLLQFSRAVDYKSMLLYYKSLKRTVTPFFPEYLKNKNIHLTQNGDMFLFRASVYACALSEKMHIMNFVLTVYWLAAKIIPFVTR